MQDDNFVLCPVCKKGTIVSVIGDTSVMFRPTGLGVLPGVLRDALIFKCSTPGCTGQFLDSLGEHQITEEQL